MTWVLKGAGHLLVLSSLAFAEPHGGGTPKTKVGHPILDVPVRREDSVWCFSEKVASEPYAKDKPDPFVYKADADKNDVCPFVVGGVNSDDCLAKTKTITGVDVDILERRLRPNREKGSTAGSSIKPKDKDAWKGVNNFSQRVSTIGFLDHDQSLRDLMRKDNKTVLDRKLTHQKVASSIFRVMTERARVDDPKALLLDRYEVKRKMMGGALLRGIDDPKKPKDMGRCDHGWIGAGVQGSPFDDDLFATHVLEIVDTKTKKKLVIDELTPHLIYRYGFYQGGEFRVAPETLIDFFDLKAD